jgi:hypothetical protein
MTMSEFYKFPAREKQFQVCHSERSEKSLGDAEILRFAQNDKQEEDNDD